MRVGASEESSAVGVAERDSVDQPDTAETSLEELLRDGDLPSPIPTPIPTPRPMPKMGSPAARRGRTRARFWRDLCIGAVVVLAVHLFVVQVSVVRGLSMSPSLRDGDRLVVDRLSYAVTDVERFDVVILRYPKNPEVDFVKRVVGLPGDRVQLSEGELRVNGRLVPEEFGHVCDHLTRGAWVVPDQSYFVLGDNRPISCDSREFGMVDQDLIKGKVRVVFWPPLRFSLL